MSTCVKTPNLTIDDSVDLNPPIFAVKTRLTLLTHFSAVPTSTARNHGDFVSSKT